MSGLNQRFAKPSTDENWSVGSNPTLSTILLKMLSIEQNSYQKETVYIFPSLCYNINSN